VVDLYNKKELMVKEICEMMNISKPTLYSYIKESQKSKKLKKSNNVKKSKK